MFHDVHLERQSMCYISLGQLRFGQNVGPDFGAEAQNPPEITEFRRVDHPNTTIFLLGW